MNKKYEYKIYVPGLSTTWREVVGTLGEEGWELVSATDYGGYTLFFKRELLDKEWSDE